MSDPSVSASVHIDARPEVVYRLITDLPTLASLAEEAVAMQWRKGDAARPGAVFTGHNRNGGRRWSTKCTVTDAEPGRRFAFDVRHTVFPVARWQYDIVGTDGGCDVTESTWDRRPGWFAKVAGRATGSHRSGGRQRRAHPAHPAAAQAARRGRVVAGALIDTKEPGTGGFAYRVRGPILATLLVPGDARGATGSPAADDGATLR